MRPRKVESSTQPFDLPGGTEDNTLWARVGTLDDGHVNLSDSDPAAGTTAPYLAVVYEPDREERAKIAGGLENVELVMLGVTRPPPLIMRTTTEQPRGRSQLAGDGLNPGQHYVWTALPLDTVGLLLDLMHVDAPAGVRGDVVEALQPFRSTLAEAYAVAREHEAHDG